MNTYQAANRLAAYLRRYAKAYGYSVKYMVVRKHGDSPKAWEVIWEEGPFEWAVCLSLGVAIHAAEANNYSIRLEDFNAYPDGIFYEPQNGYTMSVFNA